MSYWSNLISIWLMGPNSWMVTGNWERKRESMRFRQGSFEAFSNEVWSLHNLPVNVSNTAHPGSGCVSGLLETVRCQFSWTAYRRPNLRTCWTSCLCRPWGNRHFSLIDVLREVDSRHVDNDIPDVPQFRNVSWRVNHKIRKVNLKYAVSRTFCSLIGAKSRKAAHLHWKSWYLTCGNVLIVSTKTQL